MMLRAKVFFNVFLGCILCVPAWSAPIYRAGETKTAKNWLHGEFSGGYVFSSNHIQTFDDSSSSARLRGAELRALWAPWEWMSAGLEVGQLGKEKMSPWVQDYYVQRVAFLVKATLSPNTSPRLYALVGVGHSKHIVKYNHGYFPARNWSDEHKNLTYWTVGLGMEVDVWKSVFVGMEASAVYYNRARLTNLLEMDSRTETDARLRVGWRF